MCAGSNPAGGAAHRPNSDAFPITADPSRKSVTCGETGAFRSCAPYAPRFCCLMNTFSCSAAVSAHGLRAVWSHQAVAPVPELPLPGHGGRSSRRLSGFCLPAATTKAPQPSQTVPRLPRAYAASLLPNTESERTFELGKVIGNAPRSQCYAWHRPGHGWSHRNHLSTMAPGQSPP